MKLSRLLLATSLIAILLTWAWILTPNSWNGYAPFPSHLLLMILFQVVTCYAMLAWLHRRKLAEAGPAVVTCHDAIGLGRLTCIALTGAVIAFVVQYLQLELIYGVSTAFGIVLGFVAYVLMNRPRYVLGERGIVIGLGKFVPTKDLRITLEGDSKSTLLLVETSEMSLPVSIQFQLLPRERDQVVKVFKSLSNSL